LPELQALALMIQWCFNFTIVLQFFINYEFFYSENFSKERGAVTSHD